MGILLLIMNDCNVYIYNTFCNQHDQYLGQFQIHIAPLFVTASYVIKAVAIWPPLLPCFNLLVLLRFVISNHDNYDHILWFKQCRKRGHYITQCNKSEHDCEHTFLDRCQKFQCCQLVVSSILFCSSF